MGDNTVNQPPGNFFQFLLKMPQHIGKMHEAGNRIQQAAEESKEEIATQPSSEDTTEITTPTSPNPATTVPLVEESPEASVAEPTFFNFMSYVEEE